MGRFLRAAKFVAKSFLCCKKKTTTPTPPSEEPYVPTEEKALLVGINAYPGAPLNGCVNDVEDIAQFLVIQHGFKEENIRMLVDGRATTSAILERLEWLAATKEGGKAYFHYSGHGAQVPSRNGDGEVDNQLEVICPVDFDWSEDHMITDKQFVEIFKKMPAGVHFNWLSDSCHSGDLDRFMPRPGDETNPVRVLGVRRYPIPRDMAWRQRIARTMKLERAMVGNQLDVGFMSGCKSDQTSADAEIGGRPCGAFTHFFLEAWRQSGSPYSTKMSDLCAKTSSLLAGSGFRQEPTCSGARAGLPLFG